MVAGLLGRQHALAGAIGVDGQGAAGADVLGLLLADGLVAAPGVALLDGVPDVAHEAQADVLDRHGALLGRGARDDGHLEGLARGGEARGTLDPQVEGGGVHDQVGGAGHLLAIHVGDGGLEAVDAGAIGVGLGRAALEGELAVGVERPRAVGQELAAGTLVIPGLAAAEDVALGIGGLEVAGARRKRPLHLGPGHGGAEEVAALHRGLELLAGVAGSRGGGHVHQEGGGAVLGDLGRRRPRELRGIIGDGEAVGAHDAGRQLDLGREPPETTQGLRRGGDGLPLGIHDLEGDGAAGGRAQLAQDALTQRALEVDLLARAVDAAVGEHQALGLGRAVLPGGVQPEAVGRQGPVRLQGRQHHVVPQAHPRDDRGRIPEPVAPGIDLGQVQRVDAGQVGDAVVVGGGGGQDTAGLVEQLDRGGGGGAAVGQLPHPEGDVVGRDLAVEAEVGDLGQGRVLLGVLLDLPAGAHQRDAAVAGACEQGVEIQRRAGDLVRVAGELAVAPADARGLLVAPGLQQPRQGLGRRQAHPADLDAVHVHMAHGQGQAVAPLHDEAPVGHVEARVHVARDEAAVVRADLGLAELVLHPADHHAVGAGRLEGPGQAPLIARHREVLGPLQLDGGLQTQAAL
ncbi:MAG: hypothetical protein R3F60_30735 [bacterium]